MKKLNLLIPAALLVGAALLLSACGEIAGVTEEDPLADDDYVSGTVYYNGNEVGQAQVTLYKWDGSSMSWVQIGSAWTGTSLETLGEYTIEVDTWPSGASGKLYACKLIGSDLKEDTDTFVFPVGGPVTGKDLDLE